jgi:hypothetical protein
LKKINVHYIYEIAKGEYAVEDVFRPW